MVGFTEGTYQPEVRSRHRRVIVVCTIAGVMACIIAGAMTSWPVNNALGSAALVVAFGAAFWWMFGSRNAGPLTRSESSRYWSRRTAAPWKSGPGPK